MPRQITRAAFGPLLEGVLHRLRRQLDARQSIISRSKVERCELTKGPLIGQGSFGRVRMATHEKTGTPYAVKLVDKEKILANRTRDRDTVERLEALGWLAVRVWEHEDPDSAADRIERLVRGRR